MLRVFLPLIALFLGQAVLVRGQEAIALDLNVIDAETRKPVAEATVWVNADEARQSLQTDDAGHCRIELARGNPAVLWFQVMKDGFSGNQVTWKLAETGRAVPASYTLELRPLRPLEGEVRDEAGAPIAGAVVSLYVMRSLNRGLDGVSSQMAFSVSRAKTNPAGKWRCQEAPVDLRHLPVKVEHADFASTEILGIPEKPRERFLATVLKKGVRVEGAVKDTAGRPVAGAIVHPRIEQKSAYFDEPIITTGADGAFVIAHADKGASLIFQAGGFSPVRRVVAAVDAPAPLEIVLRPGQSLRGRVVNVLGKPLADVVVIPGAWSRLFAVQTDAAGRFQWTDAPEGEVSFDFSGKGYREIRGRGLKASPDEQSIALEAD